MDKLHKPLVAACKVVAAGNRIVVHPENQGGFSIEDVRAKRRKRIFERNGVYVLPCWHKSGWRPWSTSADEDLVREAEELKHVPAPILLSYAEVERHNVSSEVGALRVSVAEDFHLLIAEST